MALSRTDVLLGGAIGAGLGIITVIMASTKTGREVLKAAAKPAPRRTVVIEKRTPSFWNLFDEPTKVYVYNT